MHDYTPAPSYRELINPSSPGSSPVGEGGENERSDFEPGLRSLDMARPARPHVVRAPSPTRGEGKRSQRRHSTTLTLFALLRRNRRRPALGADDADLIAVGDAVRRRIDDAVSQRDA